MAQHSASHTNRICLAVRGRTPQARDAIARSYSPRTIQLMQELGALTYNPKVVKGSLYIGGALREKLSDDLRNALRREGLDVEEISCQFLSEKNREVLCRCGVEEACPHPAH